MKNKTVLLVDADSKESFPNLALMKLSARYKRDGWKVDFIKGIPTTAPLEVYDHINLSCIFFQNVKKVKAYLNTFPKETTVQFGGPGFLPAFNVKLGQDTEHIMPDYSLYDVDFSMGFTSRGCIRKCGFCIVPEKEGKMKHHAFIQEFHNLGHKKVVLLDNNFQASPNWQYNLGYINDLKMKVNFSQGLDIRLLNEDFANQLSNTRYYSWNFKRRGLHFAFDDMRYETEVWDGIDLLEKTGINLNHVLVYVLIGYNSTEEQDLYRIRALYDRGVRPYVMPYNKHKSDLTRWVNRLYYQFIPWELYNK
ncbi:MAG: hypothetical protein ACC656_15760 [Candidatus Heimdallarchaeota archaeon]